MPARAAAELVEVNRHTAASLIRRMIAAELEDDNPFDGKVEVDKSYFGGRCKGKLGHGASSKIYVFGILERQGKVYTKVIPDTSNQTLMPIINHCGIKSDSIVYTDCRL